MVLAEIGLDRLNCSRSYAYFSSYIMQASFFVTHAQTVHKLNIFICSSLFRALRPFKFLYPLPPLPESKSPFLHHAARRTHPQGFNKVVMNFLQQHALIEVLNGCSNFSFLHYLNTPFSCLQWIPAEISK